MPAKKDRQPAATPAAVTDYLAALAEDRREALTAVRKTVLAHLPSGYEEVMDYGMIAWQVPLSVYPDTYNQKPLMFAALASQKNHMALYLCNAYADPALKAQVEADFQAAGKPLDMGKSRIPASRNCRPVSAPNEALTGSGNFCGVELLRCGVGRAALEALHLDCTGVAQAMQAGGEIRLGQAEALHDVFGALVGMRADVVEERRVVALHLL